MPWPREGLTGVGLNCPTLVLYVLFTRVLKTVATLLALVTYELTVCPVARPSGGHSDISVDSQDVHPNCPGLLSLSTSCRLPVEAEARPRIWAPSVPVQT